MRELVETFQHDPSYLTSVVDLLERHGVARREPHPTDRRAKVVALTDRGQWVVASAQAMLSEPPACLGVLTPAERAQLLALLMRLVDAEPQIPAGMRPQVPADAPERG
jgi:DNA-binding MarR family transcriptional regulator